MSEKTSGNKTPKDELDIVNDEEILYRRIPVRPEYYNPEVDARPSLRAFEPIRHDTTGLSVFREKLTTPEEAARGQLGKPYYVAVLLTRQLRERGIEVVPRPLDGKPGHAELPGITYDTRHSREVRDREAQLAEELCLEILGPFSPPASESALC